MESCDGVERLPYCIQKIYPCPAEEIGAALPCSELWNYVHSSTRLCLHIYASQRPRIRSCTYVVFDIHRMEFLAYSTLLWPGMVRTLHINPRRTRMSSYKYRVSILATFSIYVMAGREIFQKRQQLRAFNKPGGSEVSIIENPFTSYKTTEVHITSEPNPRQQAHLSASLGQGYDAERDLLDVTYVPYSITIERGLKRPSSPVTQSLQRRQHNVALEANTAAWGYLKCAMLFFISLLITCTSLPTFHKIASVSKGYTDTLLRGTIFGKPSLLIGSSHRSFFHSKLRWRSSLASHGLLECRHIHNDILASCSIALLRFQTVSSAPVITRKKY